MCCPWCGAPVTIRGNRWECGYCGDSGVIANSNNISNVPNPSNSTPQNNNSFPISGFLWIAVGIMFFLMLITISTLK